MNYEDDKRRAWKWRLLVHVCQRWRQVVFASPQRLDLRILCTRSTPVRKNLCIWPAFPIVLYLSGRSIRLNADDDAITVLEHHDRVCDVTPLVPGPRLERLEKVMQQPFTALTHLDIEPGAGKAPTLPSEFLGGSAPSLRQITLNRVSYSSLPTLLLSAGDLVELRLFNIPPTGYISPETMTVGLAALPRLKFFFLGFQSATSRPHRILPPPTTWTVLPFLTQFRFKGASEYLEGLVSQIDSPQLERIQINYFNQLAEFQAFQLSQFVDRSVGPQTTLFRHAKITFSGGRVVLTMSDDEGSEYVSITVICKGTDWQVSHMTQLLSQFPVTLSNVVRLNLNLTQHKGQSEGIDDVEWRDLLHPFSTVKTLHASRTLAEHVSHALEDVTEGMVLPSLDSIELPGQRGSSIKKLLAPRGLSNTL
ncbi:hypothetical protein V8E53_003679 [Lactarius tabidus]|jgi:hypothetical protein